jgi:predicted TIM-barrel fold metal-dependent hydrolase
MHTHLPSESAPAWQHWNQAEVLGGMDALGIDRAVVMTLDGLGYDAVRGNDVVEQACHNSGDRLLPLGSVDPRRPDAADELHRCADRGFRAIKLHPWLQGFSPLQASMTPVAEAAAARGLPLVVHDGTPPFASPLQIAWLAGRHPDLTVVLAHGGLFDLWQDSAAAVLRYPNVHVTLCGTAPAAVFRALLRMLPPDRVSMGTDGGYGEADMTRHRMAVHRLLLEELDPDDAAAVSHRNAERLLGLA